MFPVLFFVLFSDVCFVDSIGAMRASVFSNGESDFVRCFLLLVLFGWELVRVDMCKAVVFLYGLVIVVIVAVAMVCLSCWLLQLLLRSFAFSLFAILTVIVGECRPSASAYIRSYLLRVLFLSFYP